VVLALNQHLCHQPQSRCAWELLTWPLKTKA
jgi:hypothetical protein